MKDYSPRLGAEAGARTARAGPFRYLRPGDHAPVVRYATLGNFVILATGALSIARPIAGHGHRLLCGCVPAIVAGFLLTTVSRWQDAIWPFPPPA